MTLQYRIPPHIHRITWHDNAQTWQCTLGTWPHIPHYPHHLPCHSAWQTLKRFHKTDLKVYGWYVWITHIAHIAHVAHVAHKLASGRKRMARKHPQARVVCKQAQARVVCKYLLLTLLSSTKKWHWLSHTSCRITYDIATEITWDIATEITCGITQVGKLSKGGFHSIGLKAYGVQVSRVSLHTATHCHTLQRTATHYNALQHTATHCHTLPHTATHCHTLQRTVPHCTTQQHRAAHNKTRWIWSKHQCRIASSL